MINRRISILTAAVLLTACGTARKQTKNAQVVDENQRPVSVIKFAKGRAVYNDATINYKHDGKSALHIHFYEPTVVAVASKPEKWGFFQFPHIGRERDGKLLVGWSMNNDAMEAYGLDGGGSATSADGGQTWQVDMHKATTPDVELPNGNRLVIATPRPVEVSGLKLPAPVGASVENYRKSNFHFYRLKDLPQSSQGVYLKRNTRADNTWTTEQDSLYDPQLLRYELAGKIPVVWWGDMHLAKDGSLIAGIYPGNMLNEKGVHDPRGHVFFYRSTDNGKSWNIQGRIYYQPDPANDTAGAKHMGLLEPGFEILKDGTFVCVMRTTDGAGMGPMYASYSADMGKTWTKPEVISANGVLPRVLQLDNGVVVLASGRPGVQLRFLKNYQDRNWTDPFELLPYEKPDETVSCGYTGLISTGKNRFMIVYSDFNYHTAGGDIRKAIKVREVTVDPQ